jgi:flagellin-like protein
MKKIKIKNKKALSGVVTTLIIILLVIVAVGLVWGVIKGLLDEGIAGAESGIKCLDINVYASNAVCNPENGGNNEICNVTLKRSASGDEISGVKLVFTNQDKTNSFTQDVFGNIIPLGNKNLKNINTGLENINLIEVYIYIEDESGKTKICDTKQSTKIELGQ